MTTASDRNNSELWMDVTESEYNRAWYRVRTQFAEEFGSKIGPQNMVDLALIERFDPADIRDVIKKWKENGVPDEYIRKLESLIWKTEKLALEMAKKRKSKPKDVYFEVDDIYGISGIVVNKPGVGICVSNMPSKRTLYGLLKFLRDRKHLIDGGILNEELKECVEEYIEENQNLKRLSPYWIVSLCEYYDKALNERFLELVLADRHGYEYRFIDKPEHLISKLRNELFAEKKLTDVLIFAIDELRSEKYMYRDIYRRVVRPIGFGFFYEPRFDIIRFYQPLELDYSTNFVEFELSLPQTIRKLQLKRALKLLDEYIRSFPNPTKAKMILYYMTVAPLGFVRLQMSRMRYYLLCYGASGSGKTTTIRNMSKFIWGFYGKMSGSTAESSYQRAKTFSCTTFPILIDEA